MLTADQLSQVTELAAALMPVGDIAMIIGADPVTLKDFIAQEQTPEAIAYRTGQLKNKADFNKVQISLAKFGSQAAATLVQKLRVEQLNSEL